MPDYIHNDAEFRSLLAIVSAHQGIDITLVEKDYWITHALYALKMQGFDFALKGGTSLSKGFGLIDRFSEDIDIRVFTNFGLRTEGNEDRPRVREGRKLFYDELSRRIKIPGISSIERDYAFDDIDKYRSGGIRLFYETNTPYLEDLKPGILLEAGFDNITPNSPLNITSWIHEYLEKSGLAGEYIDNRASEIKCYHPGYTLIEKIQTIIRKFRNLKDGIHDMNFMRQYYDVYCLLGNENVVSFIDTDAYKVHKKQRIKGSDASIPVAIHPALLLNDEVILSKMKDRYRATSKLYYKGQPPFEDLLKRIQCYLDIL